MNKSVTDHIREHLLASVMPSKIPSLEELRETEWSSEFEHRMRNRLIMGAFRYGRFHDPGKGQYDQVASIRRHLIEYECTGNLEHLVDVANLALVEYVFGSHPMRHWHAQDDSEHTKLKG